jgi:hypothetical protein
LAPFCTETGAAEVQSGKFKISESNTFLVLRTLHQMLEGDKTRKAGRVRIEPEGIVSMFPHLSCAYKREFEQMLYRMENTCPDLLSEWASGKI